MTVPAFLWARAMRSARRGFIIGLAAASTLAPMALAQTRPQVRPMTDAQLKKILDLMAASGAVRQIGAQITATLGAGPEDEPLTCVIIRYDEGKQSHAFAKLQDDRGFLLSLRAEGGGSHIYFADNALSLIRAVDEDEDEGLSLVPNVVAQSGLDAELVFWARKADANFQ
jgi:hypothetical protein